MPDLIIAHTAAEYEAAATLYREYASWLGIDLSFQHFEEELAQLPAMYAAPHGGIVLHKTGDVFTACIAVRKIERDTAELKRMWVQPGEQGKGIGKKLLEAALRLAQNLGYHFIRLDTLDHMTPAINLYKQYGFYEIPPYYYNPNPGAVFFEKQLGGC